MVASNDFSAMSIFDDNSCIVLSFKISSGKIDMNCLASSNFCKPINDLTLPLQASILFGSISKIKFAISKPSAQLELVIKVFNLSKFSFISGLVPVKSETFFINSITWLSGIFPWNPSTTWPLKNAYTIGIDCICIWEAIDWFSSIFILAKITLPEKELTTFSIIGVSCLQGAHQGAQKSTITGNFSDPLTTISTKSSLVTSKI